MKVILSMHKFTLAALVIMSAWLLSGLTADHSKTASANLSQVPGVVDEKLHKSCLYPVFKLCEIGDPAGSTGFIVRSEPVGKHGYLNLFLTCAHCIDAPVQEAVIFEYENWSHVRSQVRYPCIFYGYDKNLDIAVGYFLSEKKMPAVTLDLDAKLYIGSEIFKIGCGISQEPRLDFGKVTRPVAKHNINESLIRHSATTTFGDSGSPVFHNYKVIGMVKSVAAAGHQYVWTFAYALSINRYYDWSKSHEGMYDCVFERNVPLHNMALYQLQFVNKYEIKSD